MMDVLISIAIALNCGHLDDSRSVEQCRLMLNRCIYDDKNGYVACMRSMNE